MRVTQRMMVGNAVRHMDENLQRLYALSEQAASQKQFQRISDHPSQAAAALSLRSSLEASKAYLNSAQMAGDWMAGTELALKQTEEIAIKAYERVSRGISDTYGAEERSGLAEELNEMINQIIGQANANHAGSYLFAGFRTNEAPFSGHDGVDDGMGGEITDGKIDRLVYRGAVVDLNALPPAEYIQRAINPGHTIVQNIDGPSVFAPLVEAVAKARDALLQNDSVAIEASLADLEKARNIVSEARVTNGARQNQVQSIEERIEKAQIELKSLLTQKEGANMAETISNLRHQETVYQAVLEVGQRAISTMSLFEMLR
jgi:flagellar hook-associated protein 3 FlgL